MMIDSLLNLGSSDEAYIKKSFDQAGLFPISLMRAHKKQGRVLHITLLAISATPRFTSPLFAGVGFSNRGSLKRACNSVIEYLKKGSA